jgi:hypothetical protein
MRHEPVGAGSLHKLAALDRILAMFVKARLPIKSLIA